MLQFRHHFGLVDEIVLGHCAFFHHFNRNVDGSWIQGNQSKRSKLKFLSNFTFPFPSPHDAKLSGSELFEKRQLSGVDLPLSVAEAGRRGLRTPGRALEAAGEAARVVRVVFDQLGDGGATVLL